MEILEAAEIGVMMEEALQNNEIPGIAMAIFSSQDVLLHETKGIRCLGRPDPITLGDKFHMGSNTKAMTATVMAALVEEGSLSLDLTLAEAMPELGDDMDPALLPMTLRHLLGHRAGIQPFTDSAELREVPELKGNSREQREQFAHWLLRRKPFSEPGAQHVYSNAGYAIATTMMERIVNQSWENLMRERLFGPLGIDGGFGWPALRDTNQPWGHMFEGDLERHLNEWEISGTLKPHLPTDSYQLGPVHEPGGGTHLSILDFARFVQIHLKGCRGEKTILTPKSIRTLHEDQFDQGYSMGWSIIKAGDCSSASWHNGSAGTFYSIAIIIPRDDKGVVIACNAGHLKAWQGCNEMMQRIANSDVKLL